MLRIPPKDHALAVRKAKASGTSLNKWIADVIHHELEDDVFIENQA